MDLSGIEESELANSFPVRLPVWWARYGDIGPHPELEGVSGRLVMLRFPKTFSRLEALMHRLFGGHKVIRRRLLKLNSLLWELCDGRRTFVEICEHLDSAFHEEVAPVVENTALALRQMERLRVMAILTKPFTGGWEIGPGVVPENQELPPPEEGLGLNWLPLDESE